ncbi:hypothetical protein R5W23_003645 [Gemmata sp. JC673]|uniref:Toxin-antitoxin system HicB family antitoxin n=1 Tax=Gemmata algarum TaxID=2975278 RepID=A0ABU5F8K6_9BACT|nr:hypothetical protein [Gemmata algarum]MDY3562196.1 hypothetical protein [Gemmata algarum]
MKPVNLRVEVSGEMHAALKHRAIDEQKTLTALLIELLKEGLTKPAERKN